MNHFTREEVEANNTCHLHSPVHQMSLEGTAAPGYHFPSSAEPGAQRREASCFRWDLPAHITHISLFLNQSGVGGKPGP